LLHELLDWEKPSLAQERFELIHCVQEGNKKNQRQAALQSGSGK
jgi:hypothetical protein